MKIKKDFIPGYDAYQMDPKYITVHNTANTAAGATDEMHARYLKGIDWQNKSWHFTVDDDSVTQHIPTNLNGWHAGDGVNGTGNRQSIGIEICENADGDYAKAEQNAIELIRYLMEKHNISINLVVPHKHWSGKNCPRKILDRWDDFIREVKGKPKAQSNKRFLNLHKHMETWNHYPVNKPPIKAKYAHNVPLKPAKFGGLSYEIEREGKEPNTYIIKTGQFGLRKIYAPRDRDSSITSSPKY